MGLAVSTLVRPSGYLRSLLISLSALTIVCICYVGQVALDFLPAFVVGLLVAASCVLIVLLFARWSRSREPFQLEVGEDFGVIVRRLDSALQILQSESWTLCSPLTVWPHLLVLHLKDLSGQKKVIWITSDSIDRQSFRKLTVTASYLVNKKTSTEQDKDLSGGNF